MLQKIRELKGIEVCDSFEWAAEALKALNLVYGWNGSGKTTVSRVFSFMEQKTVYIPELASIEFAIQTDAGVVKSEDLHAHDLSIRVFNEDFVREHLGFDTSKAKRIIILGKENLELRKEIEILESQKKTEEVNLTRLLGESAALSKVDHILTEAGGEVPKQFGNTPLATHKYYGRTYNRTKVEDLIVKGVVTEANVQSFIISNPEDMDARRELIKSDKTKIESSVAEIKGLSEVFSGANELLKLLPKVENIQELDADSELRDWVESGYHLHTKRKSTLCKFCGSHLDRAVLLRLSRYFTHELQKAKTSIETKIEDLGKHASLEDIDLDSSGFLPDLTKEYISARGSIDKEREIIGDAVAALTERLNQKKDNLVDRNAEYKRVRYPERSIEKYNAAARKLNSLVANHNERLSKISKEIEEAAKSIELHTLAKILTAKDYFKKKAKQEELAKEINEAKGAVERIVSKIAERKAASQNAWIAVERINAVLKEFFGPAEIYLEVANEAGGEVGYFLKRRGRDAKHLSEGEKSVLALVYYLVKLEEDGFDKKHGIIVIDDPVDSQDSLFLFRMFAFLKRQLRDAGQVLILTHNFDFFNLCRDWLTTGAPAKKSQLYFISTSQAGECRQMKIADLPELLEKYKSEYQYLFSRLYRYAKSLEVLDEPLVPNVGRKVLEYFAAFKWSCKSTEGFTQIVMTKYIANDERRKETGDFVIKFANEYSHGQDFSRGVAAPMFEAKDVAEQILRFIESADKDHFDTLAALCSQGAC